IFLFQLVGSYSHFIVSPCCAVLAAYFCILPVIYQLFAHSLQAGNFSLPAYVAALKYWYANSCSTLWPIAPVEQCKTRLAACTRIVICTIYCQCGQVVGACNFSV